MGHFRIQLLLEDNTWSTRYSRPKNNRYSNSSTDWTKLNLNFTAKNYGIENNSRSSRLCSCRYAL